MGFGERVRELRVSRGWSQEQLADRLGWDRKTINRIETAANSPLLDRVFSLAAELGVATGDLFPE